MLIMPSFKKSLIVEQFQGNCLKSDGFKITEQSNLKAKIEKSLSRPLVVFFNNIIYFY